MIRASLSIALLAGALALGACGTKTVKTNELKDSIAKQYAAQGAKLHDLSCNDDIEAKKGSAIKCTALNAAESKLFIEGSVTSVDNGKAQFNVKTTRGVAKGTAVASQVKALLEKRVGEKTKGMTCPSEVPFPSKPSVVCQLTTLDSKVYDVTVTLDGRANVNVKVADKPKS